jgi:hypothetical protein
VEPLDENLLLEVRVPSRLESRSGPGFRETSPKRVPSARYLAPEWCCEVNNMAKGPDMIGNLAIVGCYLHLFVCKFVDRVVYEGMCEDSRRDGVEKGFGRIHDQCCRWVSLAQCSHHCAYG